MKKILVALCLIWFACCGFTNAKTGALASHVRQNTLDSELVTNGTFDVDASWTKGTGWSIGGSVASCAGGNGSLYQSVSFTLGEVYYGQFTMTRTGGGISSFASGNATLVKNASLDGTYSGFGKCALASSTVTINVTFDFEDFTGTVDSISVKKVLKATIKKGSHRMGMDTTN